MTLATNQKPPLAAELRGLFKIAVPLIISNFFFTLQMLIDRVMLSWYDTNAMAAAGAAAMLAWVVIGFLSNTAGFATTFVAQYVGAGRPHRVGPIVNQAIWLALGMGLLVLLCLPVIPAYVRLAGHSAELITLEETYAWYLAWCTPPMVLTAALTAFFAGRGETRIVIVINAVGSLVNGVLDYALIFGNWGFPRMGIAGAGLATALGCLATTLTALLLYLRPRYEATYCTWSGWRPDAHLMERLLRFGLPNGLGWSMDVMSWTLFTVFVGWLGAAPLAATMLVFNVNASFLVPMLGLSQAVTVLVGQRLGEDRPDLAERITWIAYTLCVGVMTTLAVVLACFPDLAVLLFEPEAKDATWAAAQAMIPTLMVFMAVYTFFDASQILLSFALRGAGDTLFVTVFTLVGGLVCLVIPAAWVCANGYSLYWVWAVATLYLAVLATGYYLRFRHGPWRTMRVIESEPKVIEEGTLIVKRRHEQPAELAG